MENRKVSKKTILIRQLHKILRTKELQGTGKTYVIKNVTSLIVRNHIKSEEELNGLIDELKYEFNQIPEEEIKEMEKAKKIRKASIITGIYKLVNTRTGEIYVGQSYHIRNRLKSHMIQLKEKTHHNKGLQEDYNNGDKFVLEVLEKTKADKDLMNEKEVLWISKLNSFYEGYNRTPGGIYDKSKGRINFGGERLPANKYEIYIPQDSIGIIK